MRPPVTLFDFGEAAFKGQFDVDGFKQDVDDFLLARCFIRVTDAAQLRLEVETRSNH